MRLFVCFLALVNSILDHMSLGERRADLLALVDLVRIGRLRESTLRMRRRVPHRFTLSPALYEGQSA